MTKLIKRTTAIILTIMMAVTFMPIDTEAAVRKPAKVKKPKVVRIYKRAAKIKWKKARGARKYQVYLGRLIYGTRTIKKRIPGQYKYSPKLKKNVPMYEDNKVTGYYYKYKKVKTLKKRRFTVKKLKGGEIYRVKVRGINGRKKGKFSKSVKIKPKAKPVVKKVSNPQKIKKPGWYRFKNPYTGKVETVKVCDIRKRWKGDESSFNGTKNGGRYYLGGGLYEWLKVKDGDSVSNSEYECYPTGGTAYMTKAFKKDVVIKWTCDGTDPALVKGFKWGHCEYTKSREYVDGVLKEVYIDTYLHGMTKYGKPRKVFGVGYSLDHRRIFWIKIYKSGKLIGETYQRGGLSW